MSTKTEYKSKTSLKSNLDIFTCRQGTRKKPNFWYRRAERGWHLTVKDLVAMSKVSAQSPLCFCNPWQGSVRSETLDSLLFTCNLKWNTLQKVNFLPNLLKLHMTYSLVKAQDNSNTWQQYHTRFLLRVWLFGKSLYFNLPIQTCCWREVRHHCSWAALHQSLLPRQFPVLLAANVRKFA